MPGCVIKRTHQGVFFLLETILETIETNNGGNKNVKKHQI